LKNKIYDSYDSAVADIPDGSTVMFPGFGGVGSPEHLISALHRQGAKQLTGISNGTGGGGGGGGASGVGALIEARQMKKMICAFTAPTHPSRTTPFIDQYNADEIDAELVPQGTLAERMRAAGAGIGAFYTPTSVGTELAEGKEHREINGRLHVLEYPLPADYAFIRAYRADTFGNLQFRLTQRNFNPVMATAATVTIVEVEDGIVPVGEIDPDSIHVPGIYVDRMILIQDDHS
jgi:3-oxoadipate CoA-transferase alpha subunit